MKLSNMALILTACTLSLTSINAMARGGERVLQKLDTNGDNMITLDEFQHEGRRGKGRLERVDTNGDGAISVEEMTAAREAREAKMQEKMAERGERMTTAFSEMDSDSNGLVTQEEMRVYTFSRMDANDDGVLTADELKPRHKRGKRGRYGRHHGMPDDE